MPDIQIVDQLDKPIPSIKIDLSQPSSILKYLKTALLHLAVFPDLLERKDKILSQAATKPIRFQANAKHTFQFGDTQALITVTPSAGATIRVNASPGTDLFDSDPFHKPLKVPDRTAYAGIGFQGSLDLGIGSSSGNLTFGFHAGAAVTLEYLKAFPLGDGEPPFGDALGKTMSSFVIPADFDDLTSLRVNDIATVSGEGTLKASGAVSVSASPNPLASVDLPLGIGPIAVQAGAMAGLSAALAISGSYQVRAWRQDADFIELSFIKSRETSLKTDLSASGGISAKLGGTELISALLGAISKDPVGDRKVLSDLKPAQIEALAAAIKGGIDHSLRASLDLVLSALRDDQAAFQYRIQLSRLSPEATSAVRAALRGDLQLLTALEDGAQPGGILAPGLTMLNSAFSILRQRSAVLKINLLGILNYLDMSQLIRNSEILTDETTGAVTIHETVTGKSITAITEPELRQQALCKAIFHSVLVTTSYRAGKAVSLPQFQCEQMHFALNKNTSARNVGDYLNWFIALNLLTPAEKKALLARVARADGGLSTCVLRTSFNDAECASMFFHQPGSLHSHGHYLELGRRALQAILNPDEDPIDKLRCRILEDAVWPSALEAGPTNNLAPLADLRSDDIRLDVLMGDVYVITHWADAMVKAGESVADMRKFVGESNPEALLNNSEFSRKRDELQRKWADLVSLSKTRFDQPWGMICLFWAAGSPQTSEGKASTQTMTIERTAQPTIASSKASAT